MGFVQVGYTILSSFHESEDLKIMLSNLSTKSQNGVSVVQRCSVENQKGAITIDYVQR